MNNKDERGTTLGKWIYEVIYFVDVVVVVAVTFVEFKWSWYLGFCSENFLLKSLLLCSFFFLFDKEMIVLKTTIDI